MDHIETLRRSLAVRETVESTASSMKIDLVLIAFMYRRRDFKDTSVGRPEVQAFVESLVGLGASKGVFVTTSTFSQQAIEFARHLTQRIILIDGNRLTDLMIEHNVGVRLNRAIEFKRIDEDFFAEED